MNEIENRNSIPEEYKPISPWGYLGYQIIFAIPLVGFILVIVFACGGTNNINVKNYARFCILSFVLSLILTLIVFFLLGFLTYTINH